MAERYCQAAILAKAPVPGLSKTRLMPDLSADQAARLAEACLLDTLAAALAVDGLDIALYLDGDWDPARHGIPSQRIRVHRQQGTGLAERISHALTEAYAEHAIPTVFLTADSPQMLPEDITALLGLLSDDTHDAAIGPCPDGGYWALAFKQVPSGIAIGIPMSTAATCEAQVAGLLGRGLRVAFGPSLHDVDTADAGALVRRQIGDRFSHFAAEWDRIKEQENWHIPIGILGCGRIVAEGWIPAIVDHPGVRLVAVSDRDEGLARAVAGRVDRAVVVGSGPREIASAGARLVIVAVPPAQAVGLVHESIGLGMNVLAEKPLSLDAAELRRTECVARKVGVLLDVVQNYRYRSDLRLAIDTAADGHLGTVGWVRLATVTDGHWAGVAQYQANWRADPAELPAGVAADKGYHLLYLAEALTGAPIVHAQWQTQSVRRTGVVDTWSAHLRHANGSTAQVTASWGVRGNGTDVLEAHGDRASLHVDPGLIDPLAMTSAESPAPIRLCHAGTDLWGYFGQLSVTLDHLRSRVPTDMSGPRRWASVLYPAAAARPPAAGALNVPDSPGTGQLQGSGSEDDRPC